MLYSQKQETKKQQNEAVVASRALLVPLLRPIRIKTKIEPIVTRAHMFSRASSHVHLFTLSFDWLIGLSVSFVIGWSWFYDIHLKTALKYVRILGTFGFNSLYQSLERDTFGRVRTFVDSYFRLAKTSVSCLWIEQSNKIGILVKTNSLCFHNDGRKIDYH